MFVKIRQLCRSTDAVRQTAFGVAAFVLTLNWNFALVQAAEPPAKASVSFRIGVAIWENDETFRSLLDLFDKYPGVTDEITFFVESTHAPIPVDEFERRVDVLRGRIAESKKRGYRSGFNILCTIGHHPEALPTAIGPEYPRAVSISGQVAQATLCMNREIFRDRVRRLYAKMAAAAPDYIWIDDDVRVGHWLDSAGTAGSICFCDVCLPKIVERIAASPNVPAELKTAFENAPSPREKLAELMNRREIRKIVNDFRSDSINDLFALIEKSVRDVRPSVELGFMTGERYDEGYDFARWAETLSGPSGAPVRWRPGGGFYEQTPISGMVGKSHEIGRQVSLLPPFVATVQSEIENFPYAPLQKSRRITALEAASHIAAGCSGAAFNVLTMNREPLDAYEPLIAELWRWRPFYDKMVSTLGRRPTAGVFPIWNSEDGDSPAGNPTRWRFDAISEIGVPVAYSRGDSPVFILARENLESLTKDEIQALLAQGVYTDVYAVNLLNDPNGLDLISWTGIEWKSYQPVDAIEEYLDDPINAGFVGTTRDQRQSFWREQATGLRLVDPNARALGRLIDYSGETLAETSLARFENAAGGRIAVAGYYPWSAFLSRSKATQTKRLFRWLSKDRLCAWVESYERARLWVRVDENGEPRGLVFLNATFDAAEKPVLAIRTDSETAIFSDRSGNDVELKATATDGPYRFFELPKVDAWDVALIAVPEP